MQQIENFICTDILGGFAEGITRRDPSPVIRVGATYHVWYSRSTVTIHGYTATIWHATSNDGNDWIEQEQALGRGAVGAFDEHAVFTPSILVHGNQYYLSYTAVPEPFYNGAPGQPGITSTAIGLAVADSPDGPWQRVGNDPILKPSSDPEQFDSLRVDDTCFVVREGRIWMYYKGRGIGRTPAQTQMGLAIADLPEGPYQRVAENPVVDGGHEVCVWPTEGGVASLHCKVGSEGNSIQFAADGIHFSKVADMVPPKAPGPFRADHYADNADMELTWGICMREGSGWAWLQRFDLTANRILTNPAMSEYYE
jgi:hypothetical protein